MDISEHLTPERVIILKSASKATVISELIDTLTRSEPDIDRELLEEAVRKREELMSTGIGSGIGLPHVRMAGVSDITMAVGVSHAGITDYESLDDKPVQIVLLIVAPQGQHEAHIRLLARLTEIFKRAELRRNVIEAETPEQVYAILTEKAE